MKPAVLALFLVALSSGAATPDQTHTDRAADRATAQTNDHDARASAETAAIAVVRAEASSDRTAKAVETLKQPAYISLVGSVCSVLVALFVLLKVIVLGRDVRPIRVLINGRMDALLEATAVAAEARGAARGAADELARSTQPDPDILRASQLYLKNHAALAPVVKLKRKKA